MATNKYPAACTVCGNTVPANGGTLSKRGRAWRVTHPACGSGDPAVTSITLNSGITLTRNARGACEDAPCCGCCTF